MKRKSLLLFVVMLFASLSTINAQETKKSLIGDYLSISGWMNIQYDYERQLQNDGLTLDEINTFNVRRARLDFKGNINKNLEFRVQADVAGECTKKDNSKGKPFRESADTRLSGCYT